VPEEGALLVAAWLVSQGHLEDARQLIGAIAPYFSSLRFYPVPLAKSPPAAATMNVESSGEVLKSIQRIRPNQRIAAQKEAVDVWIPHHDQVVSLFLETMVDGVPCQSYPDNWKPRGLALLEKYERLRHTHPHCGRPHKAKSHSAQLRAFLHRSVTNPGGLAPREAGRVQHILACYVAKRGVPDAEACRAARRRQTSDVGAPGFHVIASIVAGRLSGTPVSQGFDDLSAMTGDVSPSEAAATGVAEGSTVPRSIQRKLARGLNASAERLIQLRAITSGEVLARCLPQVTSYVRAQGIVDPSLRRLYSAVYRAFRKRRSILLLTMERQVQIEELPWISAIERFRQDAPTVRATARRGLCSFGGLALTSFPHVVLPNKLLQEFRALSRSADLDLPFVDELAADIFLGQFSRTFVDSARVAAGLLQGSLYEAYYEIDYGRLRALLAPATSIGRLKPNSGAEGPAEAFATLCAQRAGVLRGAWHPATNGMLLEQQQILTTQNLAVLFADLGLADSLRSELASMSMRCFKAVCRLLQIKQGSWHAGLKALKSAAYAWRQMIFYLSFQPAGEVAEFLRAVDAYYASQREDFQVRFRPALQGLILAANGSTLSDEAMEACGARRFLGWSNRQHWMMAPVENRSARSTRG